MANRQVFIISPIGETGTETRIRADQVLKYIIVPSMIECGFAENEVVRADTISKPGAITHQIISAIIKSDVVIADLTDLNANVFYELAIRHFTKKPCVQICDKNTRIPFDVKDQRTIMFDYRDLDSVAIAKEQLTRFTQNVLTDPRSSINPFQAALDVEGLLNVEQSNAQLVSILSKSVDEVAGRMNNMDSNMQADEITLNNAIAMSYRQSEIDYLQQREAKKRHSLSEQIRYGECIRGSQVRHPEYGVGTVEKTDSGRYGPEIRVIFPDISRTISFSVGTAPLTLIKT